MKNVLISFVFSFTLSSAHGTGACEDLCGSCENVTSCLMEASCSDFCENATSYLTEVSCSDFCENNNWTDMLRKVPFRFRLPSARSIRMYGAIGTVYTDLNAIWGGVKRLINLQAPHHRAKIVVKEIICPAISTASTVSSLIWENKLTTMLGITPMAIGGVYFLISGISLGKWIYDGTPDLMPAQGAGARNAPFLRRLWHWALS